MTPVGQHGEQNVITPSDDIAAAGEVPCTGSNSQNNATTTTNSVDHPVFGPEQEPPNATTTTNSVDHLVFGREQEPTPQPPIPLINQKDRSQ